MQAEIQLKFNEVDTALKILKSHIDWDNSILKVNELSELVDKPDFWNDTAKAQIIMRDKKNLEKIIDTIKDLYNETNTIIKIDNNEMNDQFLNLIEDFNDNNLDNLIKVKHLLNKLLNSYEG